MGTIDSFSGPYAFLSNFHHSPIELDGDIYPTVEHPFQAAKTGDPADRERTRTAHSLASAKHLARRRAS